MEESAEESKEGDEAQVSNGAHAGETLGHGYGYAGGRGNPYTKKGWDAEPGDNGGDGVGGTGTSTGQANAFFTIFGRFDRMADEGPARVIGGMLANLKVYHPDMGVAPILPGPLIITTLASFPTNDRISK